MAALGELYFSFVLNADFYLSFPPLVSIFYGGTCMPRRYRLQITRRIRRDCPMSTLFTTWGPLWESRKRE